MPEGHVAGVGSGSKVGDKRRKRRHRNSGTKTPPKSQSKDCSLQNTLSVENKDQHDEEQKETNNGTEKWRLQLRKALNRQDTHHLRSLLYKGADVNMILSDVFNDTPLLYAVKHGCLDVVEALLESREVNLEQRDRSNHTALDEAIRAWFVGGTMTTSEKRFNVGKRYRIIKCLLGVGASNLSHNFIDLLVFSNGNTKTGRALLSKLVKLFCQKGNGEAKSRLLCVLLGYRFASDWISSLLRHGADPIHSMAGGQLRPSIPFTNAIILVKASSNSEILQKLDSDTGHSLQSLGDQWPLYRKLVQLLTLSGHRIQISSMRYLYVNHAETYRWVVEYQKSPKPLKHLCRVSVRSKLNNNALWAVEKLKTVPDALKPFLIFDDVL